jgi:phosphatidylglycerol:prolipoprotein diacylglycerol transferase
MIAAIPFYELRMVHEGIRATLGSSSVTIPTFGIPLDPWATLVCLGILLGLEVSRARAIKMGLEVKDIVDGVVFTVLVGFFFAHVFTVLGYYPERLRTDGILTLFKVWEGFSSTGGFLGGLFGMFVFYRWIRPRDLARFADLILFGFPVGWLFGRMGCAVVHDHVGAPTTFPLAVAFPDSGYFATGVRHELGLYEMVLTLPMVALFSWLGRKDRRPGFFTGLFFALYAPMRFVLDFLRNTDLAHQDIRWAGLTFAQWGMIVLFAWASWLTWRSATDRTFRPWALDGEPDQEARASAVPATPEPEPEAAHG